MKRHIEVGSVVVDDEGVRRVVVGLRASEDGVLVAVLRNEEKHSRSVVAVAEMLSHWTLEEADPLLPGPPAALLDGVPEQHREAVLERMTHLREVEEGTPLSGADGTPRPEYDPATTTLAQRQEAKSEELERLGQQSASPRTLRRWRAALRDHGPLGLVDQRHLGGSGPLARADPRVIAALKLEVGALHDQSTKSRSTVISRASLRLKQEGIKVPSQPTLYRYLNVLATGTYAFDEARTRRSNRMPDGAFTRSHATRPGEWVQADTTRLDMLAVHPDGSVGAVELTIAFDVATRSITAWRITPMGTNTVDVTMLIAGTMTPEPMRPGWADRVKATHPSSPLSALTSIDDRLELAAARPVIYPEIFAVDRGKVFVSETTRRVCEHLGISLQPGRVYMGSDHAVVERTFHSINTLFCEYFQEHKGRIAAHRGLAVEDRTVLTIDEISDVFGWWVVAFWQRHRHEGLRDPFRPQSARTPNQMYAAAMLECGFVPRPLDRDDYLRLLPHRYRTVRRDGIQINRRIYDSPKLARLRQAPSGLRGKNNKWLVHYDPNDVTRVWLYDHTTSDFIEVEWTFAHRVGRPFTESLWRAAWDIASTDAHLGETESAAAEVLAELLGGELRASKSVQRLIARSRARENARNDSPAGDAASSGSAWPDLAEGDSLDEDYAVDAFAIFDPDSDGDFI